MSGCRVLIPFELMAVLAIYFTKEPFILNRNTRKQLAWNLRTRPFQGYFRDKVVKNIVLTSFPWILNTVPNWITCNISCGMDMLYIRRIAPDLRAVIIQCTFVELRLIWERSEYGVHSLNCAWFESSNNTVYTRWIAPDLRAVVIQCTFVELRLIWEQ